MVNLINLINLVKLGWYRKVWGSAEIPDPAVREKEVFSGDNGPNASRNARLLPPIQFLSFYISVNGQSAQLSNIELRSDQFSCSKTFTEGVQCTAKFADNPVTRSRIPTSQKIRYVFLLHTGEQIPSLFD